MARFPIPLPPSPEQTAGVKKRRSNWGLWPTPQAKDGALAVHPGKGNAILFYNMLADGNVDDLSLHTALPANGTL